MPVRYNLLPGRSSSPNGTDPSNVEEASNANIGNGVRVIVDETVAGTSDRSVVCACIESIAQYIEAKETWPPA